MDKIYIYKHHQFGDIYLSEKELTPDELYCEYCEDSDTLITVCNNDEELGATLRKLLRMHDLLPCDNYDELIEKYAPEEGDNEVTED